MHGTVDVGLPDGLHLPEGTVCHRGRRPWMTGLVEQAKLGGEGVRQEPADSCHTQGGNSLGSREFPPCGW
ncbi:hypothetical protein GCM10023346_21580 [Arthrobacter gyeryongensis]|uniref:Uncharacterized protein n=1 Tax=Arthrobacter gyeryongensis TaxID=1650592 RepID=A0ABP9SG26_9MICC